MKRLAILILVLIQYNLKIIAQSTIPPLYEILKDTTGQVTLPESNWQMLKDPDGKWTIEQVSQPPLALKFHRNSGLDYSVKAYWIRYRLKNKSDSDVAITIGSNAAYYDLYLAKEGKPWQHFRSGNYVPWSQRDGVKRFGSIPVTIEPGKEILVYKRIEYDFRVYRPSGLSTSFWFVNYADNTEFIETVRSSFLFGIFLLTAIINFFFFWVVRERVYFFYAMAMLFAGLLYFLNPLFLIFFKEHPKAFNYSGQFLVTFLLFFLVHTFRHFLRTFDHHPRWDKLLVFLSFVPLLVFASMFIFGMFSSVWNFLQGILYLTLFITCLLSLRQKDKDVMHIIIASLPILILLGMIGVVNSVQQSLSPAFIQWIPVLEFIFQFWGISIFSWILAQRYQKLQKQFMEKALEKERLAKEKEIEHSQLIARQKEELEVKVAERTSELQKSLEDLKTTQWKLIQSEKMASLGELTAGIAHEIQNPLNFVNNFSEVTVELGEEMKNDIRAGNTSEALDISNDIQENLKKILHHGKRADAIVKSMLQHSRKSAGEKQMTDVNALADENLRLSYHGLRAKDKTFHAKLHVDYDASIGKINMVPQDISRVLLNIFNNAFYSISEKKKQLNNGYQPSVWLSTKRMEDTIEVSVKDNGVGIPQKIMDKIFQPFFTTKPTGDGTGLGLSLSYDIVTNEHGGEIKVKTKEGEFAEFIVHLPIKKAL